MPVITRIHDSILELWPIERWRTSTVVVAVSGGADSTALLEAVSSLRTCPDKTIVAHFNHALRGEESDADQAFVESQARRLGLRCVVDRASPNGSRDASEDRLRKMRHQFLEQVALNEKAEWIALAHHADDSVETFVHNLLRGSGPSGLSAIPVSRQLLPSLQLVRPLLKSSRQDILEYLSARNLSYCTDRSNFSTDYTRNRIRLDLLPLLRSFAKSETVDARLLRASQLIAEEHDAIIKMAESWLRDKGIDIAIENESATNAFSFPIRDVHQTPWPIVRHALTIQWHRLGWPLREMNYRHWRRIQHLIDAASQSPHPKRLELPGHVVVRCRKGVFLIERTQA